MDLVSILSFFNKDRPCPADIEDCENLRKKYFIELAQRTAQTSCSHCAYVELRDKYIKEFIK